MKKRRWPRIVGLVLLAGLAAFILWIEIWLKPVYPAFEQPHDSMAELQQALSGQAGLLFPDLSGLDLAEAAYFAEVDGRTRFAHRTGNYRIEAITDSSPQFEYDVRAEAGLEPEFEVVEFYQGIGIWVSPNETPVVYRVSTRFQIEVWQYYVSCSIQKTELALSEIDLAFCYAEMRNVVLELCHGMIDQAGAGTVS